MHDPLLIARNPDLESSLPYLARTPIGDGIVLERARENRSQFVDTRERYPWKSTHQQASTTRRALVAGDDAVEADGQVVAVVERKSLEDLVGSLTGGRMRSTLTELAGMPRAAVVVEARYSAVFGLTHVRPSVIAEMVAVPGSCAARTPPGPGRD
ncbi:MAG: ERCC4 domain-containing protein [Nostocoides sp.]